MLVGAFNREGLLHDCEIFAYLWITFVSSSTAPTAALSLVTVSPCHGACGRGWCPLCTACSASSGQAPAQPRPAASPVPARYKCQDLESCCSARAVYYVLYCTVYCAARTGPPARQPRQGQGGPSLGCRPTATTAHTWTGQPQQPHVSSISSSHTCISTI